MVPKTIEADVISALKKFFEENPYSGLLSASLDHSPSEQITAVDDYYTTVLILSNGMAHGEYAKAIEKRLHKPSTLRKWRNMRQEARRSFANAAFDLLREFPVLVFAITAHKEAILKSEGHFLKELDIAGGVERRSIDDKDYLIFGPLRRVSSEDVLEEIPIKESANRAIMALFIAHFVRRIQLLIYRTIDAGQINFSFYADKFPGGRNYASLVNLFLRHSNLSVT